MTALYQDPHWPRASAWLAGDCLPGAHGLLTVVGAPVAQTSITPGRCDLAPAAIRAALERFSTADLNAGHDVRGLRVKDAGNSGVAGLGKLVADSTAVVLLGGDNSITRDGVRALGAPLERCGLITLDAHFDLRDLQGGLTNGNPVRALLEDGLPGDQIFQIGLQSFANSEDYARVARDAGIQTFTVEDVLEQGMAKLIHNVLADLGSRVDRIYVDLDLDVLDRCYAPATPGSRPGGLAPHMIRRAARLCGAHHRVHILDLVEIDPTRDIGDATSLAAAACLLEFASGVLSRFEAFTRG